MRLWNRFGGQIQIALIWDRLRKNSGDARGTYSGGVNGGTMYFGPASEATVVSSLMFMKCVYIKGVSYRLGGRPTEAIWVRKHK